MTWIRRWTAALAGMSISFLASAQSHQPKIIDVHVHYDGEQGVLDPLLKKMNAVDGMAFLLTTKKGFPVASTLIRKHPDRLVGFGDIQPDAPDVLEQIDKFHEAGFRGLGEITKTRKNYDDPSYWPIYDRAARYHMILLFHTGIVARQDPGDPADVSFDRSRATRLDLIARRWPQLIIIGAHLGNPDYAEAGEVARWNPNLYFDVSGTTLIKKSDDYTFFRSIFWWTGVVSPHTPSATTSAFEKLVFGSDVFHGDLQEFDRALARYHAMLDACHVPEPAQTQIFSGTMWHILQSQNGK